MKKVNKLQQQWFWDHYDWASNQIIQFYSGDGISLNNGVVADIGCGDGFIDLGIIHKAKPKKLIGFDINLTNKDYLLQRAIEEDVLKKLPTNLTFLKSKIDYLPANDKTFDFIISWSAFEHISNPIAVLKEMRRIIKPSGVMFIQIWPLYYSQYGSHLRDWFPDGWEQHLLSLQKIKNILLSSKKNNSNYMANEYESLNKITIDELQYSLIKSGFKIAKVELETSPFHLPIELKNIPISKLAISGIKLLATPN